MILLQFRCRSDFVLKLYFTTWLWSNITYMLQRFGESSKFFVLLDLTGIIGFSTQIFFRLHLIQDAFKDFYCWSRSRLVVIQAVSNKFFRVYRLSLRYYGYISVVNNGELSSSAVRGVRKYYRLIVRPWFAKNVQNTFLLLYHHLIERSWFYLSYCAHFQLFRISKFFLFFCFLNFVHNPNASAD